MPSVPSALDYPWEGHSETFGPCPLGAPRIGGISDHLDDPLVGVERRAQASRCHDHADSESSGIARRIARPINGTSRDSENRRLDHLAMVTLVRRSSISSGRQALSRTAETRNSPCLPAVCEHPKGSQTTVSKGAGSKSRKSTRHTMAGWQGWMGAQSSLCASIVAGGWIASHTLQPLVRFVPRSLDGHDTRNSPRSLCPPCKGVALAREANAFDGRTKLTPDVQTARFRPCPSTGILTRQRCRRRLYCHLVLRVPPADEFD